MRSVELGFAWRLALAALVGSAIAACSFTAPSGSVADDDGDDDGSGDDDDPTLQPDCHNHTDRAVMCIDFEDASLATAAKDHAVDGPNDAALTNVTATDRSDEQAAMLTKDSTLIIAESPSLDFTGNWSLELFVFADPLPMRGPGGPFSTILPAPPPPPPVYWMLNNNREYGMELLEDGQVRCVSNNTTVDSMERKVVEKMWTHVACVFDGGKMHVFVDGVSTQCTPSGAPPTSGDDGTSIGGNIGHDGIDDPFIGAIDNVAVYASALTPDRVCTLAGHTGCNSSCAGGDY